MATIDEKTNIPLFPVLSATTVLVGLVFWITSIFFQGVANSRDIDEMKTDGKEEIKILKEINDRVIRIEEQIKKEH